MGLVEARLQALEANWAKFEAQHDRLLTSFWETLASNDYQRKDLPAVVEETYLKQKGMFLDALHELRSEIPLSAPVTPLEGPRPRTTLPRIQLPQFSGRYEK